VNPSILNYLKEKKITVQDVQRVLIAEEPKVDVLPSKQADTKVTPPATTEKK